MADKSEPKIKVIMDGPYLVTGGVPLTRKSIVAEKKAYSESWQEGEPFPEQEEYVLCRCGKSETKPYCDGTHAVIDFNGTEDGIGEQCLQQPRKFEGPELDLIDVKELCSKSRFCQRAGGIWKLVEGSDDPEARQTAIRESHDCPSGRLVVIDKKTGEEINPSGQPSIAVTADPPMGVGGPLWVQGGIPIESAEGVAYTVRNRVTLCRCGASKNRPFCDGSHITCGFKDEE